MFFSHRPSVVSVQLEYPKGEHGEPLPYVQAKLVKEDLTTKEFTDMSNAVSSYNSAISIRREGDLVILNIPHGVDPSKTLVDTVGTVLRSTLSFNTPPSSQSNTPAPSPRGEGPSKSHPW